MNGKINKFLGKQKSSWEGGIDKKMLCLDTFSISAGHLLVVVELRGVILGDLLADVGGQAGHPDGIRPVKGVGQRLENKFSYGFGLFTNSQEKKLIFVCNLSSWNICKSTCGDLEFWLGSISGWLVQPGGRPWIFY